MSRLRITLTFVMTAAYGIGLLACTSSPDREPTNDGFNVSPSTPSLVTVHCTVEKEQKRRPLLKLSGKAHLPDGTILRLYLFRIVEDDRNGKLETSSEGAGSGTVEVENETFSYDQFMEGPGLVKVAIRLQDEYQERKIAAEIRNKCPVRGWEFEFTLWGDDLLSRLLADFAEVETFTADVRELYRKIETACDTQISWAKKRREIASEIETVARRFEGAQFKVLYPAAHLDLRQAISLLKWAPGNFFWNPDGSFGGAFHAATGKWVMGPEGVPFSFERIGNFLDHTIGVARREYAIWIVKDVHRAGSREAVLTAARAGPPEALAVIESLQEGIDLPRIETRIRGETRPGPIAAVPPIPKQFVGLNAAQKKLEEARKLLNEADRLWEQVDDHQSPALYKRLLKEYPDAVDQLRARVRVTQRAREPGE
jgi:hypothetical protein